MRKEEFIKRYGEEAYRKKLKQERARTKKWREDHPEQAPGSNKNWRDEHPEEGAVLYRKHTNKGGKYYEQTLEYNRTGLRGERSTRRGKDAYHWHSYKKIIAPDSQIHHNWVPGTAECTGVALVETDQHQHGIIDVILILDGEITVFTEKEIRERSDEA